MHGLERAGALAGPPSIRYSIMARRPGAIAIPGEFPAVERRSGSNSGVRHTGYPSAARRARTAAPTIGRTHPLCRKASHDLAPPFHRLVPLLGAAALARAQAPRRSSIPKDPQAVALGYTPDATKADKAKYPKYAPGQACGTCALYQGKAGDAAGPCPLYAGKAVAAKAWCSAWVKKA